MSRPPRAGETGFLANLYEEQIRSGTFGGPARSAPPSQSSVPRPGETGFLAALYERQLQAGTFGRPTPETPNQSDNPAATSPRVVSASNLGGFSNEKKPKKITTR